MGHLHSFNGAGAEGAGMWVCPETELSWINSKIKNYAKDGAGTDNDQWMNGGKEEQQ